MPKNAINLTEIAYYISRWPHLHALATGIEHASKLEEFIADLNSQIDGLEAKRNRLDADIAKLEEEKVAKFHSVAAIIPESEAQARDILNAAHTKADELVRDAANAATKMRADADQYVKEKRAIRDKGRHELT